MIPFSVLDLSPIVEGGDARRGLDETLALAQAADRLGYERFWLAEHHNMPGIASAATAIVIGHVAAGTERIRVGSGGVMLTNHNLLGMAEATLDAQQLQARPHPMITLNLGTGYGESDFLLAAVANQNISQNTASANFDAAATLRFSATKGINLSYWLDNGNGAYKINTFQASLFVEF